MVNVTMDEGTTGKGDFILILRVDPFLTRADKLLIPALRTDTGSLISLTAFISMHQVESLALVVIFSHICDVSADIYSLKSISICSSSFD